MKNKKCRIEFAILFAAVLIMAFTQYSKVFIGKNNTTRNLQYISVELVADAMLAGKCEKINTPYGLLGLYRYNGSSDESLSNDEYSGGYHRSRNSIAVAKNEFTGRQYVVGNRLVFDSGATAVIEQVQSDENYLYVDYRFEGASDDSYRGEQGGLQYVYVLDGQTLEVLQMGSVENYVSQLGLQGKIFSTFTGGMGIRQASKLFQGVLSVLFAVVIVFLSFELYKKYGIVFATVFYLVTMLSPWVIGFSTNLYWMEVTWFAPMLVGIFAANHVESKKARILSYVLAFLTVALKSACGYEYITVVMLGTIVFLLADCTMAVFRKQKENCLLLLKTIFCIGIFALLGFLVVIVAHAYIRGNGNWIGGLKEIYASDVLRRTLGGDSNMFGDVYAESLEAPIWYAVARYFRFQTPILFGIPGIVFLPLVAISFVVLLYGVVRKKNSGEMLALYIWLGIMCISWFVLGKAHSYVHTFLNYVLWYMGYMQIAFYVIVNWVIELLRKKVILRNK